MENKQTNELMEKVKECKTPEELLSVAKAQGIEMTEDQAKEVFSKIPQSGELSDDDLDNVAGGVLVPIAMDFWDWFVDTFFKSDKPIENNLPPSPTEIPYPPNNSNKDGNPDFDYPTNL